MNVLHFDGSCDEANVGAWAYHLSTSSGFCRHSEVVDNVTSLETEYLGLIHGLKKAISLGISVLEIRGDSEVVFKQLSGRAKTNSTYKHLRDTAKKLLDLIPSYTFRKIDRLDNEAHHVLEEEYGYS